MLFYLTTLNLARFLTETAHVLNEGEGDIQAVSALDAWKHSDFLCRNYIINSLADTLYNVYSTIKTAKELMPKKKMKEFETIENGEKLFMENSTTSEIKGQRKVILKMTSGKELTLNNVLCDENSLVNSNCISKFHNDSEHKCETCIETKLTRSSFKSVERNTELLDLIHSDNMWREAMLSANYLLNKVPRKKSEKTPYKLRKERKSTYKHFRVWGCLAKVVVPIPKKNASFFEKVFSYRSKEEASSFKQTYETMTENSQDEELEEETEVRRSKLETTEKSYDPDFLTYMLESEPQCYQEAVTFSEGSQWKDAIKITRITSIRVILAIVLILYVKDTKDGYIILCPYVDDILIVGSNNKMIESTKNILNSRFDIKDMGLADVILRVKISRTLDGLVLSRSHYLDKILEKFSKDDSSLARTPIDTNITYTVSKLSRYTSNPGNDHWKDSKSTSGYVFTLGGTVIS
ncbi:uncharacterized protein LOC111406711 [Olea europaea var. sylvestris]|uniref:uncharacterized protein LOC111406711 n=1 Tax=Olea europaea var. sylvestris TaxID=158386 RepID=UPI000C1CF068|nr:uncharacterized protein LOC111406711 [Olea europaea var. sylvestris]